MENRKIHKVDDEVVEFIGENKKYTVKLNDVVVVKSDVRLTALMCYTGIVMALKESGFEFEEFVQDRKGTDAETEVGDKDVVNFDDVSGMIAEDLWKVFTGGHYDDYTGEFIGFAPLTDENVDKLVEESSWAFAVE